MPPGLTFLESLLLQTMSPARGRPASEERRVHPQPSEPREVLTFSLPASCVGHAPHPGPPLSRSAPGPTPGEEALGEDPGVTVGVFTHDREDSLSPPVGWLEVPTGSACAGGLAELDSGLSFLPAGRHLLRASVSPSVTWGQWYPRAQPCPRGSWCNVWEGQRLARCRTSAGGSFLQAVPMRPWSLGPSPPLCSEPVPGTLVPEDSPLLTGRVSQAELLLCCL